MTTLLTNANCLTWDESGSDFVLHQGHLLLEESGVTLLQAGEPLPAADNLLDLRQRLVTSPLINCHHHFYSLPARGLVPAGPLSSFSDILEQLWWKLDSTLTLEAIRLAARQSIRESIRQGVLTVFDHHSSPSVTTGALSTIGTELDRFGLRGVLCHEVSDRNGEVVRNQQLAENLAFISDHLTHPSVRGMMGLHASFTLADTTLAKVAGAAIHIHLAEDLLDDQQSRELYGRSACQRLAEYDLLQRSSLLAHGNHLSGADLALLADSQSWLVHNPHSNMNNAVGTLDLGRALAQGCRVAPGTDGMHSSIAATLKQAFLLTRHDRGNPTVGFQEVKALYRGMFELGRCFFPELPLLRTGDAADLVVWDYQPLTPIEPENIWGHLIYGLLDTQPYHVISQGRFLLEKGQLQVEEDDPAQAQELYRTIWEQYHRG